MKDFIQNIEDLILFQIDKTSKVSKAYTQKEFDKLQIEITVDQWILLKIIHENKELSQKELATKSLRDPASITRSLDILEKKSYIQRKTVPTNRRQYHISLSKQGLAFVEKHLPMIHKHRQLSIAGFDNDELRLLSDFLTRIQNNMHS